MRCDGSRLSGRTAVHRIGAPVTHVRLVTVAVVDVLTQRDVGWVIGATVGVLGDRRAAHRTAVGPVGARRAIHHLVTFPIVHVLAV
eukprot:COSAG01_NODE_7901_length_3000_cov_7.557049_2_plen_85_part_01